MPTREAREHHFQAYAAITRTLRNWLVAYGVGAPAVIASQENLALALRASGLGNLVIVLFLAGVAIQIGDMLWQKLIAWMNYDLMFNPERAGNRWHRIGDWKLDSLAAALIPDVVTVILFVAGTALLLIAATG